MNDTDPVPIPLQVRHIDAIAEIHLHAFPGFFLSFLGRGFLREFYRAFLADPSAVAFVIEDRAHGVIGFVVGSTTPEGFFRRLLLRRWVVFLGKSLAALTRRPLIVPRLLRALRYRGYAPSAEQRALLSSIAVDPAAQGRGVGWRLLECWMREVHVRGCRGCYLTTDASENEAVNNFYQKHGWCIASTYFTPENRRMYCYIFDFPAGRT